MGGIVLLNQSRGEAALDKRLCDSQKDGQHPNKTELLGQEKTRQNDRDDNVNSLATALFQ